MSTARPLSADEARAFRLVRLLAAETSPYFMSALFAAQPVAMPGLGTFAVDAGWRLYMDPALLVGPAAWPTSEAAGVLVHEVGHLIRDHSGRAAQLPQPHSHGAWNYAADAEINDDLIAAGIALPSGVVTPAALGCDDGQLAEDYYRTTCAMNLPTPDACDGCGSGAGTLPVPGELLPDVAVDERRALAPADGDMIRRTVAQAIREAADATKGRGTIPAGLTRWASGVLAPPTVSWRTVLRSAVRRAVANAAGHTRHTYSRPSRRRAPGIILPAMRGPKVRVSIVVDTSGSMSTADLDAAMSEVNGVLTTSLVDRSRLHLYSCDAATSTAQRVTSVADIELVGGGGTDMRIGITAAEQTHPHVIVVLTDGDTPWPDQPTRATLVCAVIRRRPPTGTPDWATTVHITPGT